MYYIARSETLSGIVQIVTRRGLLWGHGDAHVCRTGLKFLQFVYKLGRMDGLVEQVKIVSPQTCVHQ